MTIEYCVPLQPRPRLSSHCAASAEKAVDAYLVKPGHLNTERGTRWLASYEPRAPGPASDKRWHEMLRAAATTIVIPWPPRR